MATDADLGRARDTVERVVAAVTDAVELRQRVLETLRPVLGFDAHVWVLTDPVTTVGAAPYAEVPSYDALPEIIRGKYLNPVNRWTTLRSTSSGVGLLYRDTRGDRDRAGPWWDVLERFGVVDVASAVHRDGSGTWAFLDLWRCGGAPFSDADEALLGDVGGLLAAGLRRCQATVLADGPDPFLREQGPVVVLVDDALQVVGQTEAASDRLRTLLPPTDGAPPVPAVVYNVAAQLLATEAGVDDHAAMARVSLVRGTWLTVRAARLRHREGSSAGTIAVSMEPTPPLERLEVYVRAFGLSPRERELVGRLARGSDTRAVAAAMHLSEHTIQDHLKSVFAKTGVRNRRSLLAQALGSAG